MRIIATRKMFNELDARNVENIGEGHFVIDAESHRIIYIPSHRELVLERINLEAEQEITCRRFGEELYPNGTTFSLIHDVETGEDYFMPELPGAEAAAGHHLDGPLRELALAGVSLQPRHRHAPHPPRENTDVLVRNGFQAHSRGLCHLCVAPRTDGSSHSCRSGERRPHHALPRRALLS